MLFPNQGYAYISYDPLNKNAWISWFLTASDRFVIQYKNSMFHYNGERNHQCVNNQLLTPQASVSVLKPIQCSERLGGMPKYY